MPAPRAQNYTIQDIIRSIENGEYRIPRFQRDFVWSLKQSAYLLDSIFKGYPIGAIILWKTRTELPEIREFGGVQIPQKDTGRYTSYVIDGQQRLTSLFFALKGLKTADGIDFSKMSLSLTADSSDTLVYDSIPKENSSEIFMPLKDLYTGDALHLHTDKNFKVVDYYRILQQYPISVIEIDDESLQLDEVIDVFERLNLGGKKLNLLSIVAARCYTPHTDTVQGFDLAAKFNNFNSLLKRQNYGEISDSTFLQALSACIIERVNNSDILRSLDSEKIIINYDKFERALSRAIDYLKSKHFGVLTSSLLPYKALLIPFCYFHYINGNNQINDFQEKYLIDFFWRSVIGKRYIRAINTCLASDLQKMKAIFNKQKPIQEKITLSPSYIFNNGEFRLSSAFAVGVLCLLASQPPKSFVPGRPISITEDGISDSYRRQYHHFFPQKSSVICSNREYSKHVNNVVNMVFMDALTNNQIKNRNPSDYIGEFLDSPEFENRLKSHLISKDNYGIQSDNFTQFLNARSKAVFSKLKDLIQPSKEDTISRSLPFND